MIRLGVNIDHIATIRELRKTTYPDLLEAAQSAIAGGADHITLHLREDRRHIQDGDVVRLRKELPVPLNLEMSVAEEIVQVACRIKPDIATLVPERRQELTTEGGLDILGQETVLSNVIARLRHAGIEVSLFVDPNEEHVRASRELGAKMIELHTGRYCTSADGQDLRSELQKLQHAAKVGREIGLCIAAGHGLHYDNVSPLRREIPEIVEYNIGHAIVARAVLVGLEKAVGEMKRKLEEQ